MTTTPAPPAPSAPSTAAPAPIGRRALADAIDLAVPAIVGAVLAWPLFVAADRAEGWDGLGWALLGLAVGVVGGAAVWLALVLWGGTRGRTLGMRAAGLHQLRVGVDAPIGAGLGLWSALVRHGVLVAGGSLASTGVGLAAEPEAWARPVALLVVTFGVLLAAAAWVPTGSGRSPAEHAGFVRVVGSPTDAAVPGPAWRWAGLVAVGLAVVVVVATPTRPLFGSEVRQHADARAVEVLDGRDDARRVDCVPATGPTGLASTASHRAVHSPCTDPPSTWVVPGTSAVTVADELASTVSREPLPDETRLVTELERRQTSAGEVWLLHAGDNATSMYVVAVVVDADGFGREPATGAPLDDGAVAVWLTGEARAHHASRVIDLLDVTPRDDLAGI